MKQFKFIDIPLKEIHLDLYVDESKNRKYKYGNNNEIIDYIMIMAIPKHKKDELYAKLNNARCLNDKINRFGYCETECKFHKENNCEIHYGEIEKENIKYKIADKWIDILFENNLCKKESIYFNILGIVESNLDMTVFGNEKQFGNIYTRFFRTALLRVLSMFNNYDRIIVDHIYHDSTTEMESHKYFKTSAINKINFKEFFNKERKIIFNTAEIEFIDSDHRKSNNSESQFIQLADLILGLTCNIIHNEAKNSAKIKLTEKIYPLISRILDRKKCANKNSKYNYFNKQTIAFFPIISKEDMIKKCTELYGKEMNFDKILMNGDFFCNYKDVLYKINNGQISLF